MSKYYIKKIKKAAKRYDISIDVDGDLYTFKASEDLIVEMMFLSLKEIKEEEYKEFINKLPLDSLIFEGEKYIDRRPHSRYEVYNHLYELSSSKELVNKALEVLERKRLINDKAYKELIINDQIYNKLSGRGQVKFKLESLGLNSEFDYPIDALKDNIKILTKKYIAKSPKVSHEKMKVKLKSYLLSKGYTESEIDRFTDYSLIPRFSSDELLKDDFRKIKRVTKNGEEIRKYLLKKGYKIDAVNKLLEGENYEIF
ncbi:MAG: RecX family transcriptional regulator [Gammaproteobacteria bacterium]|nr:RecX family transcriptional regulator [Gammaproteobacteria bacterium]